MSGEEAPSEPIIGEPEPQAAPAPQVPPPLTPESSPTQKAQTKRPKRLTLQERLALAAKAKKKLSADAALHPVDSPIEPLNASAFALRELLVEEPKHIDSAEPEPDRSEPEPGKETEEKVDAANEDVAETQEPESELSQWKAKVDVLTKELAALKESQVAVQPQDVQKKLQEKDHTIEQLMEEGEALSKKELKLNERVRTLVANNTKLEASLKSYSEKNEETLLKLSEIEEIMQSHKLKSVEQLLDLLEAANQKATDAQHALEKEKSSNWEAKYKELQRLYETELASKKSYMKELSESNIKLLMLENQAKLELQSKEDIIYNLNLEIIALKDEAGTEVARLESKIEGLRLENESFLKMSHNNGSSESDTTEVAQKQIDYLDYAKLSETHRNLQAQYVSSQENWKLIESNLLSKIENVTASLETVKKSKVKNAAELKKVHTQLNTQAEQSDVLRREISQLAADKKELAFQLQVKKNELGELEEKMEELKTVFNSDRQNYDLKIKALEDSIARMEEQANSFQSSASTDNLSSIQTRRFRDSGLHINLDLRPPARNFSGHSFTGSAMNTPIQHWEEANTTPLQYQSMYENNNISLTSLNEEIYPFDASDIQDGSVSNTISGVPNSSGATKNIQLISKMSSNIRRLEVDILTLREDNERLLAEKDVAQQEIVNRESLGKRVKELEERIELLQNELGEKARKEETLLEVIGEKSERVAELQADVSDLKDLLRQQVQQMIEMQSA